MKKQSLKLDTSKMLGFRLLKTQDNKSTQNQSLNSKIGGKVGEKPAMIGGKVGVKPEVIGSKVGMKPGIIGSKVGTKPV